MWAGLLTEAGELACKGYKRAEAVDTKRRHYYRFHFKLNEEIKASAISYAGLYTTRRGGELIGMRAIVPPEGGEWYMDVHTDDDGELLTKSKRVEVSADEFYLNWHIRFPKDEGGREAAPAAAEAIAGSPPGSLERLRTIWRHDPGLVVALAVMALMSVWVWFGRS